MAIKLRLRNKIYESQDPEEVDVISDNVVDDNDVRRTDVVSDDAEAASTDAVPADDAVIADAETVAPEEPAPYITPGLDRVIKSGSFKARQARRAAALANPKQEEKPAGKKRLTEFQELEEIHQKGQAASYFHEEERNAAVRDMTRLFLPGTNSREVVNRVERTLRKNLVTVAVRFKGTASRGTQTCWSTQSLSGKDAYNELIEYRKTNVGQFPIDFIWFTDFCSKEFIEEFYNNKIRSSFGNSGTMLRLSHYSNEILRDLPERKRFTTLIFGSRFEFDLCFINKPKEDLLPEDLQGDPNYIKELGLLNFNFINVLDNISSLVRLIVDIEHPDFYNDKIYNLIRRTPIQFQGLDDIQKRLKTQKYIYDQVYLLQGLNNQENVLWYVPSTWSADNKDVTVLGRDGKPRTVTTSGTNPGIFKVPEGITALNPFCFGMKNLAIRKLYLPSTLEVKPLFLHAFLPNLEEVIYAGDEPDAEVIPVGSYMGVEPNNRQKILHVPGDVEIIEDMAFANNQAKQILFANPDGIYYIGAEAFMNGVKNPFDSDGSNRNSLYNHYGSNRTRYFKSRFTKSSFDNKSYSPISQKTGKYTHCFKPASKSGASIGQDKFEITETNKYFMINGMLEYTNVLNSTSLTMIQEDAFAGCRNLSFDTSNDALQIPNTVGKIGPCAFCDALYRTKTLVLPKGIDINNIGDCAFHLSMFIMKKYENHFLSTAVDDSLDNKIDSTTWGQESQAASMEFKSISKLREMFIPKAFRTNKQKFLEVFGYTQKCCETFGIQINYI